jgi:ring-1,2-phenylacetyl-CoA epoxidase subunit PaaD
MGSDTYSFAQPPATVQAVWDLLDAVTDPEIPVVSIRELGILRGVTQADDGSIEVTITPTYSGCPAMGQIEDDVRAALVALATPVRVRTQLAPAWTTDWMSESAHQKLREYGIAPPQHLVAQAPRDHLHTSQVIQFATKSIADNKANTPGYGQFVSKTVPCPRCNSSNTTETSHFASTACKALYKCLDCLEPFDYFKPY